MMNIQDYLHLYIGCKVMVTTNLEEYPYTEDFTVPKVGDIGKLSLISEGEMEVRCGDESENWPIGIVFPKAHIATWDMNDFKPILRPLSSMKEDESREHEQAWYNVGEDADNTVFRANAAQFHYLLSKHFDLFGLIEAGLAIDATTLNHTV